MSKPNNSNALTNGVYTKFALLPWENMELFAQLHQEIKQTLNPVGYLQEEIVYEIAKLEWRKQRLAMSELLPFHEAAMPPELKQAAQGGVETLAAYIVQNRRGPATGAAKSSSSKEKGMSGETIEQAYDLAKLEKILRAETMIDNRIQKLMAKLDRQMSFEKMHGKKSTVGSPTSQSGATDNADSVVSEPWYSLKPFLS